jgi:hypothetical protein
MLSSSNPLILFECHFKNDYGSRLASLHNAMTEGLDQVRNWSWQFKTPKVIKSHGLKDAYDMLLDG